MIKCYIFGICAILFAMSGIAVATDPGLPDSMIVGRLDRSNIYVGLGDSVRIQVWLKTDDSVSFAHIPVATDDRYVIGRFGDSLFAPFSLWDDVSFLAPDAESPQPGWTSQSLLGFGYLSDPEDPQNFLMTGYQWWHIANYKLVTTTDNSARNVRTPLRQGRNRANGGLLLGLPDGITAIVPFTIYDTLIFPTTGIGDNSQPLPRETALLGAYPNPFNSSTAIKFSLAAPSDVDITIYNVMGQAVKRFRIDQAPAGEGSIVWNGASESGETVASGVYFYRMETNTFMGTSRLTLLK